jgi:hypothetical protein
MLCWKKFLIHKKVIYHLFCSACGVASFARGTAPDESAKIAINVRCLDDVDLHAPTLIPIDGRSV